MTSLERLIERWRKGDQAAAADIYQLHRTRTYRLAYALVGNPEDAEEAAQDALAYALVNIRHFDAQRSKFTTWLHLITVSRCRDILRKRHNPTISLFEWLLGSHRPGGQEPADNTPAPEQAALESEQQRTIWAAIQTLNPSLREAIVLRHWGGHTYQEIADIAGCPLRTAQSRVRLAYKQLAPTLEMDIESQWAEEQT
jgi:RNA polymerase sigma-70 factor (ECF subfamily)